MTRGQRLRQLRNFRKISQEKLAELVGVSQGTVTKLEKDKAEDSRYLYKICKILNCNIDWLETGKGASPFVDAQDFAIPEGSIPVLTWTDIKAPMDWSILGEKHKEFIPMFGNGGSKSFALRIQGDSMVSSIPGEHTFIEHEIILVDPEKTPKHGDFVVVLQRGATQAIFKQYLIEGTNVYLSSLNPRYPTIQFNDTIQICGVVIAKQKNFD